MKIRTRVLIQTLSASLALTLVLGAVFFLAVAGIRNTVLANSNELGNSAAEVGAYALEVQLTEKIDRIAQDIALLLDERLGKIENHTRTTADIAGSIYTTRNSRNPRPLPRVMAGEIPPPDPYLYLVPGVEFSRVRAEAELAGNISDMLRQIKIIDRNITTGAMGGEAGYVISMDASPWPFADYDPRISNWYLGAIEKGDLYWTDVYPDHRDRGPAITCTVPFYEQGASAPGSPSSEGGRIFRGVVRSMILLSDFANMIDSTGVGSSGQLFILNRDGIKIYSSEGAQIRFVEGGEIAGDNFLESDNPRLRSLGMSMTLGAAGMTELDMDGVPVYVAYAPITTLGWSLGVAVSVQEVFTSAFTIENQIWRITDSTKAGMNRYIFLLAGLIALLLAVIFAGIAAFAVRFTHAITGPILALNDGVHEVAGGNLEREVTVNTGDELEQLASSFNMMTGQLRKHIAEIARTSAERERIATELDIATRIQMSMLPNDFPPFRGRKEEFDLFAQVHPAKEVGGDFYDFFFIDDDHFAIIVADVSGKGIPAALFMAITKTIIKNRLQSGEAPALALEIINRQLCDNNIMDMFVTVWLSVLEISSGKLNYVNAGHNPPLVRYAAHNAPGFTFIVSPPDLVLAGMDDTRYHCRELTLESGDMLFLYTDGVVEAADSGGGFYGKERLRDFLNAHPADAVRDIIPRLRADIAAFAGGAEQSDDITMLAIRINLIPKDLSQRREDAKDYALSANSPIPSSSSSAPRTEGSMRLGERSLTIKADIGELAALHAFISAELDSGGCPQDVRGQIELAAEEVFANIVHHAFVGEAFIESRLESSSEKTTLTLCFRDKGGAFNPLEHEDPDTSLPLEDRETGGLGLLIIKKTMDTIQYSRDDGMNCLAFSKSWR